MAEKKKVKSQKDRVKPGGHPPRYHLGQSVELAVKIYEDAAGSASADEFSQIAGNSRKSSSYIAKLNALKNYGLVVGDEEAVTLTRTGERIAAPQEPAERASGLKDAFLQIEPFKAVYEKFVGKILPQDEFLRNAFIQQDVPRELAAAWVQQFVASAEYAGLLLDRGDGKLQVRGTASDRFVPSKAASSDDDDNKQQAVESREVVTTALDRIATPQTNATTPYQFLIEILDAAHMSTEEQKAVWTLIQYLKNKEAGFPAKVVAGDGTA